MLSIHVPCQATILSKLNCENFCSEIAALANKVLEIAIGSIVRNKEFEVGAAQIQAFRRISFSPDLFTPKAKTVPFFYLPNHPLPQNQKAVTVVLNRGLISYFPHPSFPQVFFRPSDVMMMSSLFHIPSVIMSARRASKPQFFPLVLLIGGTILALYFATRSKKKESSQVEEKEDVKENELYSLSFGSLPPLQNTTASMMAALECTHSDSKRARI